MNFLPAIQTFLTQRAKSKTIQATVLGTALTFIEINTQALTSLIPPQYQQYAVLLWPVLTMVMREFTKEPLSHK
jgi:hypothetical protein